jgi:DNA segregation ATPase FtsK/SpoIIIE-like protein
MEGAFYKQAYLEQQADQIESALSEIQVPARVDGGVVKEDRVRYHLAPAIGLRADDLMQAMDHVSASLGGVDVRYIREAQEQTVEVAFSRDKELRLLPLMHTLDGLHALQAVVGMEANGRPLLLDFTRKNTWGMFIAAPKGAGKSELLRAIIVSLALTSRRSEVNFIGIDLGGRELAILDALPHTLSGVAMDASCAAELLLWMCEEIEQRRFSGFNKPHLVLFIDNLNRLLQATGEDGIGLLKKIIDGGQDAGIHVVAAYRPPLESIESSLQRLSGLVKARAYPKEQGQMTTFDGRFIFKVDSATSLVEVAWLNVHDLDAAVRLAQNG